MNRSTLLIALFSMAALVLGCRSGRPVAVPTTQPASSVKTVQTIAFGSCSRQSLPQPLWDDIVAAKPDLWIWLGDNIYGDSENMDTLRVKYALQKSNPVYQ